jgi:hypothetical protein
VKQNKIPESQIQNNTWYLAYVPSKHNSIYHCDTDISLLHKIPFYESYQLPEGLACKAPTHISVRLFPNKKNPLSYILAYTVLWLSQVPGTAKKNYGDLEWKVRKRTILSTLTSLKPVRFTSLANLHHYLTFNPYPANVENRVSS